ncbi:MAG: cytochrome c biogenesis protein ResB [Desulfatibacillum sp.]|nr:cytochrome c biogenesis protein ResB [Desulfatibacillum sp.]
MNNKQTVKKPEISFVAFFASVKLSIFLLLTVAATSVIGTLIPQEASLREHYQNFGPTLFRIFDTLGFFNVYQAKWFQFLLGLLAFNLIVCTLKRFPITWKLVTGVTPGFSQGKFNSIKEKHQFTLKMSAQQAQATVLDIVRKRFRTVTEGREGEAFTVYGEKGRWTRMGFYLIHMAFLLILLGAIIGSVFGFSGYVHIPEGESVQSVENKQHEQEMALPFTIKCDSFSLDYYEGTRSISEFTSFVTIIEPGKEPWQTTIRVNHPLRLHGINLYQSTYDISQHSGTIDVQFTDPETGNSETVTTTITQMSPLPFDKGSFMITEYIEHLRSRDGHDMGPAARMHMFSENGPPAVFMMPVGEPDFMQNKMGLDVRVIQGEVTPIYVTGLKVTKDPGVWVVYAGFILILVGCLVTFFMAHQQLYIKISPKGNRSFVEIGGTANKNPQGFEERTRRIARRIENKE